MRKDFVTKIEVSFFLIYISKFQAYSQCLTSQLSSYDCNFSDQSPKYSILTQCSRVNEDSCWQLLHTYAYSSYSECITCRESQTFVAKFEASSLKIERIQIETMLTSFFNDYCHNDDCFIFYTPRLTRKIGLTSYLKALVLNFALENQIFLMRFVIVTKEGEVLAINSIKAGLYSQGTLTYDNYWLKFLPDGNKDAENEKTGSQTLTIVLVCLSLGVIIIIITVVFYFCRIKKRRGRNTAIIFTAESQTIEMRETAPTQTNNFCNQMGVNNLGRSDEPPPPYDIFGSEQHSKKPLPPYEPFEPEQSKK